MMKYLTLPMSTTPGRSPGLSTVDDKLLDTTTNSPLQHLIYPRFPLSRNLCLLIAKLPRGLADLTLTYTLSTQTIHLLVQITSFAQLTDYISPSTALSQADLFRLYCEPHEASTAILTILGDLPSITAEPSIEQLICLGMLIPLRGNNSARPAAFHARLLSDFTTGLKLLDLGSCVRAVQEATVWLTFMTAYGSSHRNFRKQVIELVDYVLQACHPRFHEWDALESVLRKFLWFQPLASDWRAL